MKKKVLAIVFVVVLAISVITAVLINKSIMKAENISVSGETETTLPPELRMQYPDRLNGTLETGYDAEDNTIIVTYGKSGTLKRIFASDELLHSKQNYAEETTQEIDGNTVTLNGKNGMIYTAAWIENFNSYFIELNPEGEGIKADEMASYVAAAE